MCCVFQPRKHVRKHTFAGQNTQQTCGLKSYFSIMIQEQQFEMNEKIKIRLQYIWVGSKCQIESAYWPFSGRPKIK